MDENGNLYIEDYEVVNVVIEFCEVFLEVNIFFF